MNNSLNKARLDYYTENGQVKIATTAGGLIEYVGYHKKQTAGIGDPEWVIRKFTWTGYTVTNIERLTGAWSNRTSLGWT